jgi:hypothetical protein
MNRKGRIERSNVVLHFSVGKIINRLIYTVTQNLEQKKTPNQTRLTWCIF